MTQQRIGVTIRAMGDTALLVETPDLPTMQSVDRRIRTAARAGELPPLLDQVPAARTVLVIPRRPADLTRLHETLQTLCSTPHPEGPTGADGPVVTLDVHYDGPDLAEVAALTGLSRAEVVRAHTASIWQVAFCGFSPGFGYLDGGDPRLRVPRLETPRTAVPAGSVGLAGEFSAVYPRGSPGGWRLIGRTDVEVWNVDRTPPALLQPGTRVRFRAVPATAEGAEGARGSARSAVTSSSVSPPPRDAGGGERPGLTKPAAALEILATGAQTLVQDLGRSALAGIGVGRSGAADRGSFRRGAALVGNADDSAALEVLLGGLKVRALGRLTMAVTGSDLPVTVDGRSVDRSGPFVVDDGAIVSLGIARRGLRGYLSVAGGIDVPPVLGSRASDTLAGLGPARPQRGDLLPVGSPGSVHRAAVLEVTELPTDELVLRVVAGPRADWFIDPEVLVRAAWSVSPRSDRIGVRLTGATVERAAGRGELASEGMVTGCLQVPPDGEPVLLMPDHPVTGGYPVIGVVVDADLDRVAQARPGQSIRFRWAAAS
jgi:KipI family sensor histidine kinase inhibitor